jgi:hypothetical protein
MKSLGHVVEGLVEMTSMYFFLLTGESLVSRCGELDAVCIYIILIFEYVTEFVFLYQLVVSCMHAHPV